MPAFKAPQTEGTVLRFDYFDKRILFSGTDNTGIRGVCIYCKPGMAQALL